MLSLGSISILNAFFGPSNGESVASIKSRPKRHLLQILQDQVEVFEPIVVEPENYTEFPPETTETSVLHGRNCTPAAIFEFPSDGFTREERKHGWITVHLLIACYCFWLLAIVCDDYFVPAIELMCKSMAIKTFRSLTLPFSFNIAPITFRAPGERRYCGCDVYGSSLFKS